MQCAAHCHTHAESPLLRCQSTFKMLVWFSDNAIIQLEQAAGRKANSDSTWYRILSSFHFLTAATLSISGGVWVGGRGNEVPSSPVQWFPKKAFQLTRHTVSQFPLWKFQSRQYAWVEDDYQNPRNWLFWTFSLAFIMKIKTSLRHIVLYQSKNFGLRMIYLISQVQFWL